MSLFHPLSVFRFFQFTVNNQVKEISTAFHPSHQFYFDFGFFMLSYLQGLETKQHSC